jgi:hypothetical protein
MNEETKQLVEKEEEYDDLKEFYRKVGLEEKGIDNFFLEIIRADDTSKIANLTEDELGVPELPVRTLIELSDDCALIPCMSTFQNKFKKQAENILSTSLSREGFLIKARITQKKELLDNKKRRMKRVGLFGKKEEVEE